MWTPPSVARILSLFAGLGDSRKYIGAMKDPHILACGSFQRAMFTDSYGVIVIVGAVAAALLWNVPLLVMVTITGYVPGANVDGSVT